MSLASTSPKLSYYNPEKSMSREYQNALVSAEMIMKRRVAFDEIGSDKQSCPKSRSLLIQILILVLNSFLSFDNLFLDYTDAFNKDMRKIAVSAETYTSFCKRPLRTWLERGLKRCWNGARIWGLNGAGKWPKTVLERGWNLGLNSAGTWLEFDRERCKNVAQTVLECGLERSWN
ncbi:hypothetical protein L6452_20808 [Arctium lappa]|uniref:Uncharacterized protein n=1 Tax=Arctium lappa TaxID=4217 RepID=A0ACB9BBL4_ARCLA|nr:hypothetical protein L6452_20808 [Arctium lappa]